MAVDLTEAGLLSAATAYLAFTVSETSLCKPFREWCLRRSRWIGKLVSCGFCLGFWFALALVVVYRPRLFSSGWLLDHLLTAIVIAWLAAFQWAALCWLMDRAGR
jgi:hypothetical protein